MLAFRRSQCPYPVLQVELRGLKPAGHYTAELIDEGGAVQRHNLLGRELMTDWELRIPGKGQSLLVRYEPR